jgi:hypothetical protein
MTPLMRCEHDRPKVAGLTSTHGGEQRFCLGDWNDIELLAAELGAEARGHGSDEDGQPFLRGWSGLPSADLEVECECACDCGRRVRFGDASREALVFRCPTCVEADHEARLSGLYQRYGLIHR